MEREGKGRKYGKMDGGSEKGRNVKRKGGKMRGRDLMSKRWMNTGKEKRTEGKTKG